MSSSVIVLAADCDRAFSLGADARIAGQHINSCPYPHREGRGALRLAWRQGYGDVELHWGCGVGGRWAYRKLPSVAGKAVRA